MVSLSDIKTYLNIDESDTYYDDLLSSLLEVANIYVEKCVGIGYKSSEKGIKLANILIRKLVVDMFENRGSTVTNNIKQDRIVTSILEVLSNEYSGDSNV